MKNSSVGLPLLLAALAALSPLSGVRAQTNPAATTPSLRSVTSPETNSINSSTYELDLQWNDKLSGVLTAPVKNPSIKPLKILGVQATGGLFVGDFPTTVAPQKEDTVAFIYHAADNSDGSVEVIRLLTDQGIKEIKINLLREDVVQADTRELHWTVGDKPEEKVVTLTANPTAVIPVRVRASGDNVATLETVSPTTYRIRVSPGSTSRSGQFAVFVDFNKDLPGKAVVILGVIQPRE